VPEDKGDTVFKGEFGALTLEVEGGTFIGSELLLGEDGDKAQLEEGSRLRMAGV